MHFKTRVYIIMYIISVARLFCIFFSFIILFIIFFFTLIYFLLACTDLGYANSFRNHANYMYEELNGHGPPCRGHLPSYRSSDEALYSKCRGNYDRTSTIIFFYILKVDPKRSNTMETSAFCIVDVSP